VQSLAAGLDSTTQTVTWNTTGLLGSKTIYVKVDSSDNLTESNETNNIASSVAIVKKKADLLITSLVIPDVSQNETGSASVTVKNEGEADVTGALVKLYDGTPETGTLLGSTTVDVAQGANSGQFPSNRQRAHIRCQRR
jgi:subtilase family serine protease